jgi:hypothetical protein
MSIKIRIYNTVILPVVGYGCEIREEPKLKNRVLGRIFSPKSDE